MTMVRAQRFICGVLCACAAWAQNSGDASPFSVPGVRSWVTGNAGDVVKPAQSGLVLMGGGSDVDEAFQWLIERSGGGDFLVLRATGADDYNRYISKLGGVDSVETLLLSERVAANDKTVLEKVYDADALWFAGGNQFDYVRFWKDSSLEHQIQLASKRGIPIGGTGGGLAILGQYSFTAEEGTVESAETLANPFHGKVKLTRQFLELPFMDAVITEPHFKQRDRFGRLIVFLARILQNGWERSAKGIGVDEKTALLVDGKGKGRVVGEGSVYFLKTVRKADVCEPTVPLSMRSGVTVYRVPAGGTFDLKGWSGSGGLEYTVIVERGKLSSTQPGGAVY